MAITDVRTKISGILTEGKKKPKDPHKKTRMGAPEATAADADACCEAVYEEVTAAPGLSPMENTILGILRQKLEAGNFRSLSQEVIDQIKASMPDKEGEIEQAFKSLSNEDRPGGPLISVSDGGISLGQPAQDERVLRDCTVEHVQAEADRIIREFSFLRRGNNTFADQEVYHGDSGRGMALVDRGDEVAVRFDNGVQWVPRSSLALDNLTVATYIAPVAQMQTLVDTLTAPGSKFTDKTSGWEWSMSKFREGKIAQCDVKAPPSFHKQLSALFLSKDDLMAMNETIELTDIGLKLAVESLTFVPKK